mmetsp:Transcript_10629/g.20095  ORF Transcript_10629/g.20095 Transcript_10629/m.20095 type:complete len:226 (-) Transcript_10629:578-1255(-)
MGGFKWEVAARLAGSLQGSDRPRLRGRRLAADIRQRGHDGEHVVVAYNLGCVHGGGLAARAHVLLVGAHVACVGDPRGSGGRVGNGGDLFFGPHCKAVDARSWGVTSHGGVPRVRELRGGGPSRDHIVRGRKRRHHLRLQTQLQPRRAGRRRRRSDFPWSYPKCHVPGIQHRRSQFDIRVGGRHRAGVGHGERPVPARLLPNEGACDVPDCPAQNPPRGMRRKRL